ncbi:hypothetical protein Prudu_019700 [Prunus dulcis]|uniref:Uncharacterized protein n=1 Tax=Prunus dulcis TaxID=3755 RepID=A0A4Y1RVA5_PRUDU|nr:hypothetical protein Prudu_019700 [Prunus dulcis]
MYNYEQKLHFNADLLKWPCAKMALEALHVPYNIFEIMKLIRNCIALEETKTEMHNSLFRDSYTLSRGSPSSPVRLIHVIHVNSLAVKQLDQVPERGFLEKLLLPFIELVLYVSNDAVESIDIAPKLDIVRFVVKICNKQPETAAQNLM